MDIKLGYVTSNFDIRRTGTFMATFNLKDPESGAAEPEKVRYVSPYGSDAAGWVAIPQKGSYVLVGYPTKNDLANGVPDAYYYLGSLYGGLNGGTSLNSTEKVGVQDTKSNFPPEFASELYEAKGAIPEKIGFTGTHGDAFTINNRFRSGSSADGPPLDDFTDHRIEMRSGSGKKIKCVDTPSIDAIIIENEHKGKDKFVWQSTDNDMYAEGEVHLRTHGPIKQWTSDAYIRHWVQEGQNIEIINESSGKMRPGKGGKQPQSAAGSMDEADGGRFSQTGPEDYGCVIIESQHNNIVIRGLEDDSCIRVLTPGSNGKVLIDSGGTIDLRAATKISLTSPIIELSADQVDINGTQIVDIDALRIDLN